MFIFVKRIEVANETDEKMRVDLFEKVQIGNNAFNGTVNDIFNTAGVKWTGLQSHMTDHGLQAAMIFELIASGHSDSSRILGTCHLIIEL